MDLFASFKRLRNEHPHLAAFRISAGDRSVPISWRQYTDDIAATIRIIEKYGPGSTIGLLGENSYEWMVSHAACLFGGATVVHVDPNIQPEEVARRLRFVGARALIHSALYNEKAEAVERLSPGLAVGGFGTRLTDAFLDEARTYIEKNKSGIFDRDDVALDRARTSMIVFTSGTTSEPRGAELTIAGIETFCESTLRALPMKAGDRSLMMLPLHHIFGICATYAMLSAGVTLGVCPDFRRIQDVAQRFRINFAFLVPALAEILAAKIERRGRNAEEVLGTRIEWIVTGGAPISRRAHERLQALGIRSLGAYGLTETTACYSMSRLGEEFRPGSAGQVSLAPGVETRVSAEGELLVRGPNVMKGYYKMPEKTAQAIDRDGWFHTGDRGRIDEEGFVWIVGRASRTIVLSSGKKVAPEELEEKLLGLPGVLEAVVSGEGESRQIAAEIYASIPEEQVHHAVSSLNKLLPVYQRISRVIVRPEPFPRTSSGKICHAARLAAPAATSAPERISRNWLKFAWPTILILGAVVRWLSDMVPEIIRLCRVRLSLEDQAVCAICELAGDALLVIGFVLAILSFTNFAAQIRKRLGF